MWNRIIAQSRVRRTLSRAKEGGRVAHAYLFHGPDGVGKRAMALAFAQSLQCQVNGQQACGTCTACNKVRRMIHPDVHMLIPSPKDASVEDLTARLQRLAENPFATIDFVRRPSLSDPTKTSNKQALYTVDRINLDLRRKMSLKPVEGRYKVAIMTDADLLRTEAANAFLKLLEEPGPRTVFMLTTSRPDRLLPTILSRCQKVRFGVLTPEAIAEALIVRQGLEASLAATVARMANGSYSRALDLSENESLLSSRELVINFFRFSYTRNIEQIADAVDHLSRLGREHLKGVMDLMLGWIRDLLLYRTVGEQAPIVNVDQLEIIRNFCTKIPDADILAMVSLVEEALELTERNVHLGLILTVLSRELGRAMHGEHNGKLYLPLEANDVLLAAV